MIRRFIGRLFLALVLVAPLGSCAPTPENCALNQTATGALVGAGVGGALGAIGAAAGGARGGTGLAIAAGAALAGAAIGAAIGHHQDEVCHQLALQQALDQAMLANAAWQQKTAAGHGAAPHGGSQTAATATQRKPASHPKGAPASQPEYQTVAWADKQSSNSGAITPVSTLAETSGDQVCMLFNDQQTSNGQTHVIPGKACRGPDGEWKPVT